MPRQAIYQTHDGTEIYRVLNPASKGYSYYAKAGPDGDVLIWNSDLISLSTLAAVISMHTAKLWVAAKEYIAEFNMHGWHN